MSSVQTLTVEVLISLKKLAQMINNFSNFQKKQKKINLFLNDKGIMVPMDDLRGHLVKV
jgi:hypothetical protein